LKGFGEAIEKRPFDATTLTRLGIVALGRDMSVTLGVSGMRFYKHGEEKVLSGENMA